MEVNSMKKIVLALALSIMYASLASATDVTITPANIKGFNRTNKVNVAVAKNGDGNAWGAASAHEAGDKEYATTSAFGGLSYKTVTPSSTNGKSAPSAPQTPTDSAVPTNYTAM